MSTILFTKLSTTAQNVVGLLAQAGDGAAPAPELSPVQRILGNPLLMLAGILVLFYMLVWLPERRKRAETLKRLSQLKKNDRVVTSGGIHAVVVSAPADSDVITLRVDENTNTRIRVSRAAIGSVVSGDDAEGESKEANKS